MENQELLNAWDTEKNETQRNEILSELRDRGLFPKIYEQQTGFEKQVGLYPNIDDPQFTKKLLQKQEFSEDRQDSVLLQKENGVNPCDPEGEFELTPVQRFVGRFLSPECPYLSALLYHGVGVGKTCAGITVAENYLAIFPRKKVIIVAPPTIQPGFRRTIFDIDGIKISEDDGVQNVAKGCTGNTYLKLTGMEFEKDRKVVIHRVKTAINSRYEFFGYTQFQNYIESLLKRVPAHLEETRKEQEETAILRREFSGRLLIIDEAHNIRDIPGETEEDNVDFPDTASLSDSAAGKKLTPNLLRILRASEGMKLVLMTGTPMYNNYREIIFMMNILLTNDKKAPISEKYIFTPDGRFKPGGEELLGSAAAAYVSFMRGETPLSFPVRLKPQNTETMEVWPSLSPDNVTPVPPIVAEKMLNMPLVPVSYDDDQSYDDYITIRDNAIDRGVLGIRSINEMVQAGNWIFPGEADIDISSRIRDEGFKSVFQEQLDGTASRYKVRDGLSPLWLSKTVIKKYSPKADYILNRIPKSKGIIFIYSRFVASGGLTLALALEANGYTLYGRDRGLLINGVIDGLGRQCAECPRREKEHADSDHKFRPAKYIILTGSANISPNNASAIDAVRNARNKEGSEIKVVIGSQVASEGVDFRFIREIYIFDSWFHLNKLEQVIGRGVRNCSHSLLDTHLRNCTIYWLVNVFHEEEDIESADLYMYRNAFQKAVQVGRVTRVLKRYALDCNLNQPAILVNGFNLQTQEDSQGVPREDVNINDVAYSSMCDWLETCEYKCKVPVNFDGKADMTTYDEYAARWREATIKKVIKYLFEEDNNNKVMFQFNDLAKVFSAIPPTALQIILSDMVGSESFQLKVGGKTGYLIYKNGYYLFQPSILTDESIPLALRIADIPVKRDFYDFKPMKKSAIVVPPITREVAEQTTISFTNFWKSVSTWGERLADGTADDKLPTEFSTALTSRYTDKDEQKNENQRMAMVLWLYTVMKDNEEWRKALSRVMLECIWDTVLNYKEQERASDILTRQIGAEQYRIKGTTEVFRHVDYVSGDLIYICKGEKCSPAVTKIFDTDPTDAMNSLKCDVQDTGAIYGFLIPKKGYLVFKSGVPPPVGKKPDRGSECAIISTIAIHVKKLFFIGEILQKYGFPTFDLSEKEIGKRPFQNSARACMLMELILRWMDIMKVGGYRWFYRPVASYKTQHRLKNTKK